MVLADSKERMRYKEFVPVDHPPLTAEQAKAVLEQQRAAGSRQAVSHQHPHGQ